LNCWPLEEEEEEKMVVGGRVCVCGGGVSGRTRSIQQMDKKLSLCILIGRLRLLFLGASTWLEQVPSDYTL